MNRRFLILPTAFQLFTACIVRIPTSFCSNFRLAILIILGVSSPLLGEANPDSVRENQRVTVHMFPELGVKDSQLNIKFVERVKRYREQNSKIFDSYDWPYRIALESVADLKLEKQVAESLRKAYLEFPDLKTEGSPLQRLFKERSEEYLDWKAGGSLPVSDDWPYRTAKECFEELEKADIRAVHAATPAEAAKNGSALEVPTSNSAKATATTSGEAPKVRGGAVAIIVVLVAVALFVFGRSPSNFLRILVDLFGLGAAQELGRRLSGSPPSPTYIPPNAIKSYDVQVTVGHQVFHTRVNARNLGEARQLVINIYPGAKNVFVQETRK